MQHTPGPWAKEEGARDPKDIPLKAWECERLGFSVCFVNGHRDAEARANAHLIAATPDLLAACQAMDAHYSGSLDHQPAYVKLARAALAKATPEAA